MTTGRAQIGGDAVDQAIGWHLRLSDATRGDWLAFTDWLEASPENAAAYDRLTLDDALLSPMLDETAPPALPVAANDRGPLIRQIGRIAAAGGAIAAALLVTVQIGSVGGSASYAVETGAGARKQIAFADGSRILLNSGTRVTLRAGDTRFAALDRGEATFLIRHDAAHPFTVRSGERTLQDLGTVFNVSRDGHRLGVQVSQGAVMFEPASQALTLRPGVSLAVDEQRHRVELSRIAAEDVGGWQVGRLSFGAVPLASVAAAVSRATGAQITVAPEIADTPFTGTITVAGDAAASVRRLARLTGTVWRRNGVTWVIASPGDEARKPS